MSQSKNLQTKCQSLLEPVPSYNQRLPEDAPSNIGRVSLHLLFLRSTHWYPRPLYTHIEYSGQVFVWPGEKLPLYFRCKMNWVAVGPPTSCLISDLKGLWVDRAEKLIPSFTLPHVQCVCSGSKCVIYDKEVAFETNLAIFNADSQ